MILNNLFPLHKANAKVFKDILLYNLALFAPKEVIILQKLANALYLSAFWGIMVNLALLVAHFNKRVHEKGIVGKRF